MDFSSGLAVKNLPAMQETQVRSLGQQDPLEEGMTEVTGHTSTPQMESIGEGLCVVGHAATKRSLGKAEQKVRWSQTVYGLY